MRALTKESVSLPSSATVDSTSCSPTTILDSKASICSCSEVTSPSEFLRDKRLFKVANSSLSASICASLAAISDSFVLLSARDLAESLVTSTKESDLATCSGSFKSINPALSKATASFVPLSSPRPLDAPFLSSSDSFNSSSEGSSASGTVASEPSGPLSILIPIASPAASKSAWIALIMAGETCPSCMGSITPLGPIPEARL